MRDSRMGPIHLRTAQALGSTAWAHAVDLKRLLELLAMSEGKRTEPHDQTRTIETRGRKKSNTTRAHYFPARCNHQTADQSTEHRPGIIIKTQSEPRAKAVHGFAHLLRKEWKVEWRGGNARRVMSPIDRLQSSRQNMKKEIKGSKSSRAASAFCLRWHEPTCLMWALQVERAISGKKSEQANRRNKLRWRSL